VNRGTCVWTTCPRLLPGNAPGESWQLASQTSNLTVTAQAC